LTVQKKTPQQAGNIDKNINSHEDYNVKSGEGLTCSDVVEILQKYKTALIKKLNRKIHLFWNTEEQKMDWSEADSPLYKRETPGDIELNRELLKIRNVIQFDDKQIAGIIIQYAGGVLCKVVENWLSKITNREAQVLFHSFINHDYEMKYGIYIGLGEREIAKKMNIHHTTVMRIKKRAINHIIELNNS